MKWKVLSSRYLEKDPPWCTLRVDTMELPNGEILENYYVMEYPDWVTVIALTRDLKLVMVDQYRHALGLVGTELPAGVIDDVDPDPLFAAKRELLEETGFGNGEWESYMQISANPGTHTNMNHIFLARNVEKIQEQELDRTEDIHVKLMDINDVKNLLEQNKIYQSMHAAPLWKLLRDMNY